MLSNYEYCDDDFNPNGLGFQLPPKSYDLAFDLDKDDKPAVDTQSMPRPPLRSKHGMYFSGHHSAVQSAVGSDFGFPVPAAQSAHFRPPAPSHMLGSTLRSSLDPSIVTFFLLIIVHITDYHWDRHLYFVIHSHHAQTMIHTPPSDDSLLVHLLVVSVAFQVPVLVVSAWRLVVFNLYQ
jgi:hypothetical protein